MKQLVLVDAKNMVFRHHWTHKDLRDEDGKPTSVLYGFLNGLLSLSNKMPDARFVFVWDGEGRTWRHDLLARVPTTTVEEHVQAKQESKLSGAQSFVDRQMNASLSFLQRQTGGRARSSEKQRLESLVPKKEAKEKAVGYKANRQEMWASDGHQDALEQIPELQKALRQIGFKQYMVPGLEGDDLLAMIATKALEAQWFDEVAVHSTDKDFYQLLPEVKVLKRVLDGRLIWASEGDVFSEHSITCADWTKLRALIGDPSDNIPRVFKGVGPANALKWLRMGVNPSLKDFELHPKSVRAACSVITNGKRSSLVQERWPEVWRNYQLCELARSPYDARIIRRTQLLAIRMMEEITSKSFAREPRDDWKVWFTAFCIGHQMPTLWGRRDEFDTIK